MATKYWRGAAKAIAQITRISFSAYTSGETYTVTCGGKSVSFVATASTAANVIDGLVAAISADAAVLPEFADFSAANDSDTYLQLTGNTAGVPFTVSATASTGSPTVTEYQAATGPNHFDDDDNWSGGTVPSAGDDLVFRDSAVSLLYALVDTTNYGDITIESTFTGEIGLAATNSGGYPEYRTRFLTLGDGTSASTITIGQGGGSQSPRILIDANDETVNLKVYGTGFFTGDDYPVIIKNSDSSSTVDMWDGAVKIDADSSGSAGTVRLNGSNRNTQLFLTDTVTAGAITQDGGMLTVEGGCTSLTINGGVALFTNAATCPTMVINEGASVTWASTAGITTALTVYSNGTIDFSANLSTKTITGCTLHKGSTYLDPAAVTTVEPTMLGIKGSTDVNFVWGQGRQISFI